MAKFEPACAGVRNPGGLLGVSAGGADAPAGGGAEAGAGGGGWVLAEQSVRPVEQPVGGERVTDTAVIDRDIHVVGRQPLRQGVGDLLRERVEQVSQRAPLGEQADERAV